MAKQVAKVSKFEKNLITKMDAEEDKNKIAELAFRRAHSTVKQQIAALEVKRVDLEILSEQRQLDLDNATYNTEFTINGYDAAKQSLDNVQDELADVEATIEARKKLLAGWE